MLEAGELIRATTAATSDLNQFKYMRATLFNVAVLDAVFGRLAVG